MRWSRFRVRTLMIVVVASAMVLGTIAGLVRRREFYLRQAERHRRLSDEQYVSSTLVFQRTHFGPSKPERALMDAYERRGDYHAGLQAKYERAARYPFLPVAPDPPEPE